MRDALAAPGEETPDEVGQRNQLQNEEDERADETIRDDGEVESQNETDQEARCEEVDWTWAAEELVDEELFPPFLHGEGDQDEDCADVESGSRARWEHD